MSPSLLRSLWKAIDESPTSSLVGLNEQELINQLLIQIQKNRSHLTPEEVEAIRHYVHARSPLIADLVRNQRAWFIPMPPAMAT